MTRILASLLMLLFVQTAMAQRKHNKTGNGVLDIYMTMVKGGSFDMGSNDEGDDRKPAHTVVLKDFYIGTYEVTQQQWKEVMGNNPSQYQCDECPVTNVSWKEVQDFISKLNAKTGKHYRLPTEAEWEYAARGGANEHLIRSTASVAPGGVNEFMVTNPGRRVPDKTRDGQKYSGQKKAGEVAWYDRNSENHVHPIGRKHANELGVYDMTGNVEEWCNDWYGVNYGSKNTAENPQGPAGGSSHVVRGGSISSNIYELSVVRRAAYVPGAQANSLGFRLAE